MYLKIGVFGSASGSTDEHATVQARAISEELAKRGHIVITGAALGLPMEAIKAAHAFGGMSRPHFFQHIDTVI